MVGGGWRLTVLNVLGPISKEMSVPPRRNQTGGFQVVYPDLAIDLPRMQEGFRPKDGKIALSSTKANPHWLAEWVVFCIVFQFVKSYIEHVGLNCAMCLMGSVHATKWWWWWWCVRASLPSSICFTCTSLWAFKGSTLSICSKKNEFVQSESVCYLGGTKVPT